MSEEHYSSSLKSNSFGFRLGINFTDNFTIELAKQDHGDVVNNSVSGSYKDDVKDLSLVLGWAF